MAPEIVNTDQAKAWNGDEGASWTEHEARYNDATHHHGARLFAAAGLAAADHVLDIGCGCGESTRTAARTAVSGRVLGVDLSAPMIQRAREHTRAEGLTNVRFEQADVQVYPFEARAFDIVISRFGVMFFADPVAAFRNIRRALRPDGRVALVVWQELRKNEWLSTVRAALAGGLSLPEPPVGAPGPFGLADADADRRILTEAGYTDIAFEDVREPVRLGANRDDAFAFVRNIGFARMVLENLDDEGKAGALDALLRVLGEHETDEGVLLGSSAWLITAANGPSSAD